MARKFWHIVKWGFKTPILPRVKIYEPWLVNFGQKSPFWADTKCVMPHSTRIVMNQGYVFKWVYQSHVQLIDQ